MYRGCFISPENDMRRSILPPVAVVVEKWTKVTRGQSFQELRIVSLLTVTMGHAWVDGQNKPPHTHWSLEQMGVS